MARKINRVFKLAFVLLMIAVTMCGCMPNESAYKTIDPREFIEIEFYDAPLYWEDSGRVKANNAVTITNNGEYPVSVVLKVIVYRNDDRPTRFEHVLRETVQPGETAYASYNNSLLYLEENFEVTSAKCLQKKPEYIEFTWFPIVVIVALFVLALLSDDTEVLLFTARLSIIFAFFITAIAMCVIKLFCADPTGFIVFGEYFYW